MIPREYFLTVNVIFMLALSTFAPQLFFVLYAAAPNFVILPNYE